MTALGISNDGRRRNLFLPYIVNRIFVRLNSKSFIMIFQRTHNIWHEDSTNHSNQQYDNNLPLNIIQALSQWWIRPCAIWQELRFIVRTPPLSCVLSNRLAYNNAFLFCLSACLFLPDDSPPLTLAHSVCIFFLYFWIICVDFG